MGRLCVQHLLRQGQFLSIGTPTLKLTPKNYPIYTYAVIYKCFVHLENFSLIWRHHHYMWRLQIWPILGTSAGSCAYCDTGHPRTVTLTVTTECSAVELSLHVLTTSVCRGLDLNTQPSACGGKHHPRVINCKYWSSGSDI